MYRKICSLMIVCCAFLFSHAQDCDLKLRTAQDYKSKKDFDKAITWYQKVLDECGDYNGKIKAELSECKNKISPKKPSSSHTPNQQSSAGVVSNRELYFDAEGNCENNTNTIIVNYKDWNFDVRQECKYWLRVERYGNSLVVTCNRNQESMKRCGNIDIIGEANYTIKVEQRARKNAVRTNSGVQDIGELPITVKITFENGKAKPKFENNVGRLITAMAENNDYGLQIDVYKCENQSELKNLIKTPLIDRRFKEIVGHFVSSGIAKDRISKSIIVINEDKVGAECNCAYAKVVSQVSKGEITTNETQNRYEEKELLSDEDKDAISELSNALSRTKIFFNRNEDIPKIDDPNGNINRTVTILKANPSLKLIIEGYTSDRGSEQENRDLAQRRANNVRKLFIEKGVDPSQIETASYTVDDPHNRQDISDPNRKHDYAIFRIVKR